MGSPLHVPFTCPLWGCTGRVRLGLFLALHLLHSRFPPGNGAPRGVRSSAGPVPLAFPAKADLSKLCYCAEALLQKLLLFSMQLIAEALVNLSP